MASGNNRLLDHYAEVNLQNGELQMTVSGSSSVTLGDSNVIKCI